jgi:hypothetical protein
MGSKDIGTGGERLSKVRTYTAIISKDDDEDSEEDETSNTSMSPPSTSISQPLLMMAVYVLTLLNLSPPVPISLLPIL